jgi:hypothetical protein
MVKIAEPDVAQTIPIQVFGPKPMIMQNINFDAKIDPTAVAVQQQQPFLYKYVRALESFAPPAHSLLAWFDKSCVFPPLPRPLFLLSQWYIIVPMMVYLLIGSLIDPVALKKGPK